MYAARKAVLSVTSTAGALLLVAGCGSASGPSVGAPATTVQAPSSSVPERSTTDPAPSSQSPSSTADPVTAFHAGQCLNQKPEWTSVSCDESHFYEVTAVVKDKRYAGNLIKRAAYRTWLCGQKATDYLGGQQFSTLLYDEPLPTAADPQHAKRIVCLVRHAKAADSGSVADRRSLKGVLKGDGAFKYRICLSNKASGEDLHLTSCKVPHVSEATWGFSLGTWGDPFPGVKKLNRTSLAKCRAHSRTFLGGVTRSDVAVAQNSSGESAWMNGYHLTTCFVQVRHGKVTGTLKGIGHKPLSSIR